MHVNHNACCSCSLLQRTFVEKESDHEDAVRIVGDDVVDFGDQVTLGLNGDDGNKLVE